MAEDGDAGEAASGLVERREELGRIERLLDAAGAGDGGGLLLEGEAGIGKTALLARAAELAAERGALVLRARGGELERDHPFGVARQLFEAELAAAGEEERAALLAGAASLAAPLVRPAAHSVAPPGDPSAALHGLHWLAANAAAERPLTLVVDDLHWADDPSLRWLIYLVRRLEDSPIALLCSIRVAEPGSPTELLERLRAEPRTEVVEPERLSAEAVAVVVGAALSGAVDDGFAAACREVSGGNPFLLAELVDALDRERVPPTGQAAERVREIGPAAVSQGVLVRLAAHSPDAIALAEAAAVLGSRAELREAAALARLDPTRAGELVDSLAAARILAPGPEVELRHPLVRNAIHSNLGGARRAAAHARAARVLGDQGAAPERISAHLLEAVPAGDPWVVERLEDAAERALAATAVDSGLALLRRALAEPPPPGRRAVVLQRLGAAEALTLDPAAEAHLGEALELAEDTATRASIAIELAVVAAATGRARWGAELLEVARAELGSEHGDLTRLVEAALVGVAVNGLSTYALVDERLRSEGTRLEGKTIGERSLLAALAIHGAIAAGPRDEAVRLAERALAPGPLIAAGGPHSIVHDYTGCLALILTDRLDLAVEAVERFLDAARSRGSLLGHQSGLLLRAQIAHRLGALEAALDDARQSAELAEELADVVTRMLAVGVLVDVQVDLGRLDEAQATFDAAGFDDAALDVDSSSALWLRRDRARLHLAQGRPEQALADQLELGRRCAGAPIEASPGLFPWRSEAALALVALGRDEEAARLAAEEVALARQVGAARPLGLALRAQGLATGGEPGVELLREAVAVLEPGPARLAHAQALVDLGAAVRRGGGKSAAREPLRAGLELAHRCGAGQLAERALVELRATGARPRRPVLTGTDALTASELRVARMATGGMSNPEIAQGLFVTRKTVERHLANAYAKLGIGGRDELAAALAEPSATGPGTSSSA